MTTVPDTSEAVAFLSNWKPDGPWPLCAFHEDGSHAFGTFGPQTADALTKWVQKQNYAKRNIYFHTNTVSPPENGKALKTHVQRVDWLHVDVDPVKGRPLKDEQERILAKLQEHSDILPRPNIVIFSGGGYQGFWRLEQPIEVLGVVAKVEEAERYNVQIAKLLQADACHNADRIMRLPGTINWPNKKKRDNGQEAVMAKLVIADWEGSYPVDKFMKAPMRNSGALQGSKNQVQPVVSGNIARLPAEALTDDPRFIGVSAQCKTAIVLGHDPDQALNTGDNSASAWLWYVVCELVRNDIDDETIYSIITDPDFGISAHVLKQGNAAAQQRAAMRAIQRGREHQIDPNLQAINDEYAVIESVGGKMRIACERWSDALQRHMIEFHLRDGFLAMYSNKYVEVSDGKNTTQVPVGKWWLSHPNRRQYRDVVFFPNRDFDDSMNLWRGFGVEAVPGDCQPFLDHIRKVVCRGNQTHYDYLIKWMANAVQNPHIPGQVAVVMRGGQGTGKGTFGNLFGKLFGTHYKYVSNPKHVTGQFNSMLTDAVLVFADECFAANDRAAEGALKSLITESTLRVEPKGVDNMEARNCVHLIMATNSEWAISADMDDRRFFVLDVDKVHQADVGYFTRIRQQMEAGGYEALLYMLMHMDLSTFNVYNCPKTAELRRQQDQSMDDIPSFVLGMLEDGRILPTHSSWQQQALTEAVAEHFRAAYPSFRKDAKRALGRFLAKIGVTKDEYGQPMTWTDSSGRDRKSNSRPKVWVFPSLEVCRKLWDEAVGSGRDWPDVGDDDPPPEPSSDGGEHF